MALTINDLRTMDVRKIFYGDRNMAEYIQVHGNTEAEARALAQDVIKGIDKYRQPSLMAVYERTCGDWVATIQYFGLD
jgi:hypothetical protein